MKVYKVIKDYFYTPYMNDRINLKKGDLLFIEKGFLQRNDYSKKFKEVNLLTKVIKSNEIIIVNTIEPFLSDYGLDSTGRCFHNFDELSSGFRVPISGSHGYFFIKPLEDITIQYLRDQKLKELL
jgi:hypothetical protein